MSTLWSLFNFSEQTYALLVFFAVFTPLERLIPAQRGRAFFRPGWSTDLLHFMFTAVPTGLGMAALISGATVLGNLVTPGAVREWLGSEPVWLQVAIGIVLGDLFFYFGHRVQHEVPWLWDFHALHHSSKELDWLSAFRIHPVDQMMEKGTALVPIFALGFSDAAILTMALIYQWHSLLIHSNVRLPFGRLKWLVATPEFHHWHHSDQAEGYNKNFGGQLPLWDLVFGTAYLPSRMPERYGIQEPMSGNYLMQLIHPFARLARRLGRKVSVRRAAD